MQRKGSVIVNNLPDDHCRYVVARVCMGTLWYWTSWDSCSEANQNIRENKLEDHAVVIEMEER